MNTNNSEINIFIFFSILKKNIITLIFIPIAISGILSMFLFSMQNNSNNSGNYNLKIYENDFLRNEHVYDYNILLALSFQDILAYQTTNDNGFNIVDKSSLIGFDAQKLLNSLQLIDNRNIDFLANSIKNNTRFLNYIENNIKNDDKKNKIKKFLSSLQIIKLSNDDDSKNLINYRNINLSFKLNEEPYEFIDGFLNIFEEYLKFVLFDDFNKFMKYYNLVISNQTQQNNTFQTNAELELQKKDAFKINKELKIKKIKNRIEILKENNNIAKNFKDNKQLNLIREMSFSSTTFDINNIIESDFPVYIFGSDFLEAEIDRLKLVISRLSKAEYSHSDDEPNISKKYLDNLKANYNSKKYIDKLNKNFNKINFNFDNLTFFHYDFYRNIINPKISLPVSFVLAYLFSLLILIFYFVLNYIFLSQKKNN